MSKSVRKLLLGTALVGCIAAPALAQNFNLGRIALPEEIAAWDVAVEPDGTGLPAGSGDVLTGEDLWIAQCASCHGDFGEGAGAFPVIAGGIGTLTADRPVKTVGSYWPYLSTVWDYVHRSMPFGNAQSLTADEVYAITAYILYSNGLVEDDFELSHENFLEVRLPNEGGFIIDDRDVTEVPRFSAAPCMTDCAPELRVTMRATDLQSTPDGAVTVFAPDKMALAPAASDASAPVVEAGVEAVVEAPAAEAPVASGPDPVLVAAGEGVWKQCRSCHQVGDKARNGTGPMLNGIVGHQIGAIAGFKYSKPMQEAGAGGQVWTAEALDAFLADPKKSMPGTRMAFRGLNKADDRAAVIAYLQSNP